MSSDLLDISIDSQAIGPLMLDVEGLELTGSEKAILANPLVGGLILFSRNFKSPKQLAELVAEVRAIAPNIIIAVDHEGGRVQRFRDGFTVIPPMASLGKLFNKSPEDALQKAKDYGWIIASELLAYDIDLSFAPVLDRDHGISDVIGDRAFSADADIIIELTSSFIDGMHEAGMVATGKHFPGHGGVAADSHHEIPVDTRSLKALKDDDLYIFTSLISDEQKLDALMPAHVIYSSVDKLPAGFSKVWLQTILRKELGFDGVIFSDDLAMEGASVAGSFTDRAKAALNAGCDMILVCNHPTGAKEVLNYLESIQQINPSILQNDRLGRLRLNKSKRKYINELKESKRWKSATRGL
jgi:beta-N-acetylhexosaminidase